MALRQYLQQNKGQALLTAVSVIGTILMSVITIAGYLSIQRIRTSRSIWAQDRLL